MCVGLAACSSTPSTPSAAQAKVASTSHISPTSTTVPGATIVPYNKYNNARLDVTISGPCTKSASGQWTLSGSIINPDPVNATAFSIVVDFIHEPGGTVLDTAIVNIPKVASKKTAAWKASWTYSGSGLSCVVRQAQVKVR